MATKDDYCLYLKDKQKVFVEYISSDDGGQYTNLNLNQNHKQVSKEILRSKSITTRKAQNYDINDSRKEKDSNLSWKSKKLLSQNLLNFDCNLKDKDESKKIKNANNSTLSLHIAEYENSVEGISDSDDKESVEKKLGKLRLINKLETANTKQSSTDSATLIHNSFEFPRQQEEDQNNYPEIMQFKASKRLLNPNEHDSNDDLIPKENTMQPVEFFNESFDRGNEASRDVMEYNENPEANEQAKYDERKRRRNQIHNALMARDAKNTDSMEYQNNMDEDETPPKTYKIRDLMTPVKRAIKLPEIMKMDVPKPLKLDPFIFPPIDPFDDSDAPSILDNIPHTIPECLAVRQSYTTKYLRGVQRCLKENVYDYRLNPEFDPLFPEPDPEIPSLAEAISREKEERIRLFKREQVDKDRERMPPPPVPQTPSTSDESNPPHFSNGQSTTMGNSGGVNIKEEMVTEKKFGCKVEGCTKSYKNLQGLKTHVKKEHPGVTLPSKLSHSEESILATTLGAPPRLPPPPVNQRLPQLPTTQKQRSKTPQQQQQQVITPSNSRPMTPQQPQTPSSQHRYEMQQTPTTPQHPPQQQQQQQQQYVQSPQHNMPQQQQHHIPQQPQQQIQQVQYAQVTIPVSQAYPQQQQSQQIQNQQSQGLPPQQQQARLPAPPTQIYQQQSVMESPQSVPSEYSSAVASPMSVMSPESVDETTMAQNGMIRKVSTKPQVTVPAKMKCPHCSKCYKTHQNLQKHIRDVHPQMLPEVEVSYSKPPQQTTTYYVPPANVNRQDVMYVEQQQMSGADPNMQQQDGRSVTIVRQQPQMHIIDDQHHQQQGSHIPQNQIVTSQAGGQTIVHYQVQQVPIRQQPQQHQQIHQQQQQHHPQQSHQIEMDSSQQQMQQQQTYTPQGPSPDVIMIDSTPPATPRNVMTPIVSSIDQPQQHHHQQQQQQQQPQSQQVYIQTSNGQLRPAAPGQQYIRQQGGRSVLYQSQPIHIIQQQPFSGEKYTVVVKQPQNQYRTVNPQQISRNGQQIISNQQGNTYAYPVTQTNNQPIASRYYAAAPQRGTTPSSTNQIQNPATSSANNNPSSVEGGGVGGENTGGNDYYSTPPQLTPQQAIPSRPRPQQGTYKVYSQGRGGPSQVRTITVTNPGQKGAVKYALQVPQGNLSPQTYMNPPPGVQYVRTPSGNIAKSGQVQFITAPVRVNPQRPGQPLQQYPVTVTGQPVTFSSRTQQPYTVRGQNPPRGRIVVPAVQGTPRRPQRPITQLHQQQQPQQQQQQLQGGPQEGQTIQIQRLPQSSQQQLQQSQPQQSQQIQQQSSQMDLSQPQQNPE